MQWGKGHAGDGEVSRIKRDKKEKQGRGENRTAVEGTAGGRGKGKSGDRGKGGNKKKEKER